MNPVEARRLKEQNQKLEKANADLRRRLEVVSAELSENHRQLSEATINQIALCQRIHELVARLDACGDKIDLTAFEVEPA